MRKIFALWMGLSFMITVSEGQSYRYNSLQYGLRSTLLGGAVVAGSEDLSMVYYNPAALSYAKDKGFDLALIIPSFNLYGVGNYFSENQSVSSNSFDLNSSLVTFKTGIGDQFDIVFSFLQKDTWDNKIAFDELNTRGNQIVSESFQYEYQGDEKWFGFGSSYQLNPKISVGLSHFVNVFKSSYRYTIGNSSQMISTGVQSDFFSEDVDIQYATAFGFITKLGVSINMKSNRFGFVVTTPSYLNALQNGSYEKIRIQESSLTSSQNIIANYNLDVQRKTPWEISAGYAKIFNDSTELWLSLSYNSEVGEYDVLQINNVNSPFAVTSEFDDVLNFGIGVSANINPKIQFLSSIRSSFFAYHNRPNAIAKERLFLIDASFSHLASGVKVNNKNSSFVVGLDFGFSSKSNDDLFKNFSEVERFRANSSSFRHNTLTVLLTYEFFLDRVSENISKLLEKNN